LLTAAGAAITGSSLRSSWGAPMTVLSGLLVVALMNSKFSLPRLKRIGIGAFALIVVVSGLYFGHMAYGSAFTGKALRGNWPQAQISAALEQEWRDRTNGAPLTIVAGDIWTGGLIGFHDRNPPSVLINGDYAISPWITPAEVEQSGALVVWSGSQPRELAAFAQDLEPQELIFTVQRGARAKRAEVRVHYAILPPQPAN
jgi:hypothetical protein